MTNVVLAKLESESDWSNVAPPFGILYVAHSLEQAGFSVKLFHETGTEENIASLVRLVERERPIFVGFSVITGPGLHPTLRASERIKSELRLPIVWGGLHATMLPEVTLKKDCIDFVALGDGEPVAAELAEAIRRGRGPRGWETIPGLAYRSDGQVRLQPRAALETDLDLYRPAWHLLDRTRYLYDGDYIWSPYCGANLGSRIATIITSRGCPWRCAFCYNQAVNHRRWRAHSAERVLAEVGELRSRYSISAIVFEDDCLFTDPRRALAIVRGLGVAWSSSIRADILTSIEDDYLSALRETGCAELRIGAESGSDRVLGIMQKDITREEILKGVRRAREHGIFVSLNLMVGLPGETWDDVLKTLDLMDELDRMGGVTANGPSIYSPWPGTALYDEAIRLGYEPPQTVEVWGDQCWNRHQLLHPFQDPRVRFIGVYRRLAKGQTRRGSAAAVPLKALGAFARARWRRRYFGLPLDIQIPAAALKALGID